jgi:hypothetical protein
MSMKTAKEYIDYLVFSVVLDTGKRSKRRVAFGCVVKDAVLTHYAFEGCTGPVPSNVLDLLYRVRFKFILTGSALLNNCACSVSYLSR